MAHPAAQSGNCLPSRLPTIKEVRQRVRAAFNVRNCRWQYQLPEAVWGGKHVILDVGTGSGKTLAFYIPALFAAPGQVMIVVTALNILAAQNVAQLEAAGIPAIAITGQTATKQNFEVGQFLLQLAVADSSIMQDIADGKYTVVIASPEQLVKWGEGFEALFRDITFRSRIISVVFDEGHCITQWGSFRPEYSEISRLRYLLPETRFIFASATFSPLILNDIKSSFGLSPGNFVHIRRPNDRPNVHIGVRKIEHALNSYRDLAFLAPDGWTEGNDTPRKFVAFFDSITEAIDAGESLRRRLPPEHRNKILWFHSDMSEEHKAEALEKLRTGEIWGLCATDSFGMVCTWLTLSTVYSYML